MPRSLIVGVIGQTMRGDYCRAHFDAAPNARAIVLTDDPRVFVDWDLPPGVEVIAIEDSTVGLREKLRRRLRRRVVDWLKGGSALGARAELAIRKVRRPRSRVDNHYGLGDDAPVRQGLIVQLAALHEMSAIGEIVVFDVIDLPSVLEFSDRTGVPVLVR